MSTPISPATAGSPALEDRECLDLIYCPLFRPGELTNVSDQADWLWHGYLARGQMTLLTGQWKIGKTALLATLLARLGNGTPLAGREVRPGRAIVLTEEGAGLWMGRCRTFGIGENVSFGFRPFIFRPDARQWKLMIENLDNLHRRRGFDLLVIDPLATIWPCQDENSAAGVTESLRPLRELARRNVAVLLLHHPRKDGANGGRASRGSGALSAFVDILIEMQWYAGPETPDRRRRLLAWSRHDATPRQLLIELTPDGTNYIAAHDNEANATPTDIVRQLLTTEPGLTFRELLTRWPAEATRPTVTTLHRCLTRMTDDGELARTGAGHRHEPYRYWLVVKADSNNDLGEMKNDL